MLVLAAWGDHVSNSADLHSSSLHWKPATSTDSSLTLLLPHASLTFTPPAWPPRNDSPKRGLSRVVRSSPASTAKPQHPEDLQEAQASSSNFCARERWIAALCHGEQHHETNHIDKMFFVTRTFAVVPLETQLFPLTFYLPLHDLIPL